MRKAFVSAALLLVGTAAHSQNSNTNCYMVGTSMQCSTYTQPDYSAQSRQMWQNFQQQQQQQDEQLRQTTLNAIAVAAERQRERKAAEQAQAQQAAIVAAANAAIAADPAIAEPAPSDEKPVMLVCTSEGKPLASLALYEKHSRLDVTTNDGATKTRTAVFTPTAVSWHGPIWDVALNRLDGTFLGTPNISGAQQLSGSCSVATERKF